jgi:hypothetical protein
MEHSTLPLWKSKLQVANVGRIFFHLDDMKNN